MVLNLKKLKHFLPLKNSFNLILIVLASFFIKLSYFILTKDQPLWWDEAEYLSAAKKIAFNVPYDLNPQRPLLFQLIAAFLLKAGSSELSVKFLLVLVPSIVLTIVIYFFVKELYNKKIALFAAFFSSINWSLIFWSNRFQPDYISMCFQVLALYFACVFWKGNKSNKTLSLIGIFAALGFQFKVSGMIVLGIIFVFSLIKDRLSIIKSKEYWKIFGWFLVGMIPQFILSSMFFGNPLSIFLDSGYAQVITEERQLGWQVFSFLTLFGSVFPKNILFFLLVFGIGLSLSFLFNLKSIMVDRKFNSDLFVFIGLTSIIAFYLFYIRGSIEDRWVFLLIPFIYALFGKALSSIHLFLSKYSRFISVVFIIFILLLASHSHISYSSSLIKDKKSTYSEIKEACLFLKENSNPEDKVFSVSLTQCTAYSERQTITYARMSIENFTNLLNYEEPRFIMVSIIEPNHPDWIVKQVKNDEGFQGILFPYFNSSIIISPQNQIVQYDIKDKFSINGVNYDLVYPNNNNFGGILVYEIGYNK